VQALPSLQGEPPVAIWQSLAPLHLPVLPQTLLLTGHIPATRGTPPAAMELQVPTLPVSAQLSQPPVQVVLQQMPVVSPGSAFTQFAEVQSLPTVHTRPLGSLSPHLFVWVLQVIPGLQSVVAVQVVRQVAAAVLQI